MSKSTDQHDIGWPLRIVTFILNLIVNLIYVVGIYCLVTKGPPVACVETVLLFLVLIVDDYTLRLKQKMTLRVFGDWIQPKKAVQT